MFGHLAKQFGQVIHPGFNFAVELDLTFFHAIKFSRCVAQTIGGVAKSGKRGVEFNHALANCKREDIQLANVLLQAGGNGKEGAHRNHQKAEQADQHDARMQHIASAHVVYFDHHIAHFLADVGCHLSRTGGDFSGAEHHTGEVFQLSGDFAAVQGLRLQSLNTFGDVIPLDGSRRLGQNRAGFGGFCFFLFLRHG